MRLIVLFAHFIRDAPKYGHLHLKVLLSEIVHLDLQVWYLLYLFECHNCTLYVLIVPKYVRATSGAIWVKFHLSSSSSPLYDYLFFITY